MLIGVFDEALEVRLIDRDFALEGIGGAAGLVFLFKRVEVHHAVRARHRFSFVVYQDVDQLPETERRTL